jgi:hypothetical protein
MSVQVWSDNMEYSVIWHLSSPMRFGLIVFYSVHCVCVFVCAELSLNENHLICILTYKYLLHLEILLFDPAAFLSGM